MMKIRRITEVLVNVRQFKPKRKNTKISFLSPLHKKKASIKMGAFLFVYIPRQTKNVVRPSYDGQSLMSKDSVT